MTGFRRVALLAWLALAANESVAFTPKIFQQIVSLVPRRNHVLHATLDTTSRRGGGNAMPEDDSLLKAYDQWRNEYGKGVFNQERYEFFKSNYVTLKGANASAIKRARDQRRPEPSLMNQNEYGDCSIEEYKGFRNNGLNTPEAPSSVEVSEDSVNESSQQQQQRTTSSYMGSGFQMLESAEALQGAFDDFQEFSSQKGAGAATNEESLSAERIRNAYIEWCKWYDKNYDEARLEIFSAHFQKVEKVFKETGKPVKLNEHADLTTDEYQQLKSAESSSTTKLDTLDDVSDSAATDDNSRDDVIRDAFVQWSKYYAKTIDDARFDIFKSNYLKVEQYHKSTGNPVKLNAYADLTMEEYKALNKSDESSFSSTTNNSNPPLSEAAPQVIETVSEGSPSVSETVEVPQLSSKEPEALGTEDTPGRVRHAYTEWCKYYGKEVDESRLSIFASNFLQVEQFFKSTGTPVKLNEFADLTTEEYASQALLQAKEEARLKADVEATRKAEEE
jgi:hypothetical protein